MLRLPLLLAAVGVVAQGSMFSKGAGYRREAGIIRRNSELLLKRKFKALEAELEETKSALENFGRQKLSAIKGELKDAERILFEFHKRKVFEINENDFPRSRISGTDPLSFGTFGTKAFAQKTLGTASFLSPVSFAAESLRKLENACEFNYRVSVLCKSVEQRILVLQAVRKRTLEGSKVLGFLTEKLKRLLAKAEEPQERTARLFESILGTASAAKRIAETNICLPNGSLSDETEKLFNYAFTEALR